MPFLIANQLLFLVVGWGVKTWRGQQYSLALFPLWIRACTTAIGNVYFGRSLGFVVTPPDRARSPGHRAETASAEQGGSKADWIRALFGYLAAQPDVTAVVWFDHLKETDWRLGSSHASAAALREALLARRTTA